MVNTETSGDGNYDPRVRPWYVGAVQTRKLHWSENKLFRTSAKAGPGGFTAIIGQWAIDQVRGLIQFTGIAVAVSWQGLRPLTWRRTGGAEFFEQCHQIGLRALPFLFLIVPRVVAVAVCMSV